MGGWYFMSNMGNLNSETKQIQGILENYLRFRHSNNQISNKLHPDEDLLTAFVEGTLSSRETKPIVSHLVDCSFCCHITAELIKLDLAFSEEEMNLPQIANEPKKVSEIISGLFSKIFGSTEGAVFAHQEPEEEVKKEEEKPKE